MKGTLIIGHTNETFVTPVHPINFSGSHDDKKSLVGGVSTIIHAENNSTYGSSQISALNDNAKLIN